MADTNDVKVEETTTEVVKDTKVKKDFVNPFEQGVTYEDFLNAIPKGKTIEEYCNKKLDADQLEWLLNDLKHYKKD